MYTAFGMVMGAMIGCAVMALYKLGLSMPLAGALVGGAFGTFAEVMLPQRKPSQIA
jgi:hypothetical protein